MGNQPGKLQTAHSGRPKKNVHWKSAGKCYVNSKKNKPKFRKFVFPIFHLENISNMAVRAHIVHIVGGSARNLAIFRHSHTQVVAVAHCRSPLLRQRPSDLLYPLLVE